MRLITLLILLSLTPALSAAEPPAPALPATPTLTADEAVEAAVRNNPRLAASTREISASESGVRSASARTNPTIAFVPALTDGGSDEEFIAQQPLELNGTRGARTAVAKAQLRGARARAVLELREVVFETRSAYYSYVQARELRDLARASLSTAQEFDRNTRRLVELGSRPGIDRTQTGIEVVRSEQELVRAEGEVAAALAALNTLMGRAPGEPIDAVSPLEFTPQVIENDKELLARAIENRAELTAVDATREGFLQEARLARAEGRPDLAPQFRAGSITRGTSETGIGLAVTLPLFDYGSRRNRVRQAETSAEAERHRLAATRGQVEQQVAQATSRLRASEAVVNAYRQGVLDQARRLLESSRVGFQAGASSVLAVLEAQRTYRSVQAEYINALVSYNLASAELERATGAVPETLLTNVSITQASPE